MTAGSGAAAKFFGLEDDEVFVEGLQSGVGEARWTVEDGSAEENHVEPLEERAAGETVKDGFLVKAASVEVGMTERGDEGGILQTLITDDEIGFHG